MGFSPYNVPLACHVYLTMLYYCLHMSSAIPGRIFFARNSVRAVDTRQNRSGLYMILFSRPTSMYQKTLKLLRVLANFKQRLSVLV